MPGGPAQLQPGTDLARAVLHVAHAAPLLGGDRDADAIVRPSAPPSVTRAKAAVKVANSRSGFPNRPD